LEALAQRQPVLLVFEDVHWADPTSIELLDLMVERTRRLAILMLITFRPEFEPSWAGLTNVGALTLQRLGRRDVEAIVGGVADGRTLPSEVMEQIVSKADGVPLFVEELTKAILESGLLTKDESSYQLSGPLPLLAIPLTLQDSLMARLDRLGPAKEIAQIGAAIGREFPYDLLRAVARIDDIALRDALDRLEVAELVSSRGKPPKAAYTFKHALVQDAAYGTLLREPRRALHARIADVLESQFAEIAENQPELLARHCTEAELIEKAAGLWGKAGQRSLARSALVEAVEQLTRAIDQMATLPGTTALRREQIKLQVALINALFHVKGYAAPETKAATEQARILIDQAKALGEAPEDPLLLFSVLYSFWVTNLVGFNSDVCCDLSTQFLSLAEKQGATVPLMVGHQIVGISLLTAGDIRAGQAHYDQAISLYDPVEHQTLATRFGQDSRIVMLSRRSAAMWLLGYPEAALADSERAVRDARDIGHAATLMYALSHGLFARYECGNYTSTIALFNELIELAEEKGSLYWKTWAMMNQGCVYALTGQPSHAIRMITSGLRARQLTGSTMWVPFFLSHLARAQIEHRKLEDAWHSIDEAITAVETTKERWCEAEVYGTAGEITLLAPEPEPAKAEEYFARALAVARYQQAKSWELRTAISLARLWCDQGKRDEARNLLAPVYGWFTEGFDTRDLKEAKALLEGLQRA
jgi:predicted ATPase